MTRVTRSIARREAKIVRPKWVMGIDLGTTNTCVAIWRPGSCPLDRDGSKKEPGWDVMNDGIHIIEDAERLATDKNGLLRSCVTYFADGTRVVGKQSLQYREKPEHSRNTVYDVKCLLGQTRADLSLNGTLPPKVDAQDPDEDDDNRNSYWTYRLASIHHDTMPHVELSFREGDETVTKHVTPVQVLSHILKKAKHMANVFMRGIDEIGSDEEIYHAVITIPAVFNQQQKNGVRVAARLAGLEVMEMPTEPAAAAFAYGFDRHTFHSSRLLTFDFGGGTLDVNIVEVEHSHLSVFASRGERLGGRHFDAAMFELVNEHILSIPGVVINDESTYRQALLAQCERMKQELTQQVETILTISHLGGITSVENDLKPIRISREQFENYPKCQELLADVISAVQRALDRKELQPSDIKHVLLIGGSSEMPMIRNALEAFFQHNGRSNPIFCRDVPANFAFQAVAKGAAIRAAQLSSIRETLPDQRPMTEVVSLPIGVGFGKGAQLFSSLVDAGFRLPRGSEVVTKSAKFRPMFKGRKRIVIKIFEGNSYLTAHNHLLGEFVLELGDEKAVPEIELNAELNSSGELKMSVRVGKKCEQHEIRYLEQRSTNQQLPQQDQLEIDEAEYHRLLASYKLQMALDAFADRMSKYPYGATNSMEEGAFAIFSDIADWFTQNESTASREEFTDQRFELRNAGRMLKGKGLLDPEDSDADEESSSDEEEDPPNEEDYHEYNGRGRRYRDFSAQQENWEAKRAKRDGNSQGTSEEGQGGNDDENFLMPFAI